MIVVCNSSPIIDGTAIASVDLFKSLFKEIRIPTAVYDEVDVQGENKPGMKLVAEAEWISTETVRNKQAVADVKENGLRSKSSRYTG